MPHLIKGQKPSRYRPSVGRSPSKLTTVQEAVELWNRLNTDPIPPGHVRKGRFLVDSTSPKKKSPASAKRNRVANYMALEQKIYSLEEKIIEMKREFSKKIYPLEDKLEEYHAKARNLKKSLT